MRTYKQIYIDFCNWLVEKTGNSNYEYETFIKSYEDEKIAKAFLYKSILKLCYDKHNGLYYFCKFIVGDLIDLGYPKPFRYNSLFRKIDKILQSSKHVCIEAARGHGKSVAISQMYNLYSMFIKSYFRIIIISASQDQANRILTELKLVIENNEWLAKMKDGNRWASSTIGYNKGYILVAGIGAEILGEHVDRIIVDDILRSDNKLSYEEIEDYIDMNLEPMLLNRNGQMIIVGTPKSYSDIFSTIKKRIKEGSSWIHARFPAIIDYDKKILQCPDRFTWDDIIQKKMSMGAMKFDREYQLEIFSRDKSLFPEAILKPAIDKGETYSFKYNANKVDKAYTIVGGIDVARSGKASADYTVVTILAYNPYTQDKILLYMWKEKGLKISEQARKIAEISDRFNHPFFLVEDNNMGQDLIDELVDNYNVNIGNFHTGGKGQKKDELILFLVKAFEHEKIILPRADDEARKLTEELLDELRRFCVTYTPAGNERFEGLGTHDDMVISLALAIRGTQECGIPFAVTSTNPNSGFGSDVLHVVKAKNESDLVRLIQLGVIE